MPATAADLLSLPADVAAEIIDGEIVEKAMSFEHGMAQINPPQPCSRADDSVGS
jgi:hypothetical protein